MKEIDPIPIRSKAQPFSLIHATISYQPLDMIFLAVHAKALLISSNQPSFRIPLISMGFLWIPFESNPHTGNSAHLGSTPQDSYSSRLLDLMTEMNPIPIRSKAQSSSLIHATISSQPLDFPCCPRESTTDLLESALLPILTHFHGFRFSWN
jgi:hypothetical protein